MDEDQKVAQTDEDDEVEAHKKIHLTEEPGDEAEADDEADFELHKKQH